MAPNKTPRFQELPPKMLREIATVSIRMPKLYWHPIRFVRKFFWARLKVIYRSILTTVSSRQVCIDFGCGTGVFLPSLAAAFETVQAIDIEAFEAQRIVDICNLKNVRLINLDIYKAQGVEIEKADAIVAADVLEHFQELETPVRRLHDWLKDDGLLFTSGPSENLYTRLGRKLGGMEKPWDHYHTGYGVEEFLESHGFARLAPARHVYRLMPMYVLSIWRKAARQ